ncbi:neutral ceramidase [Neurospora intermedia]|uniref:Neutral ceramidase n=1 Tax=Neurospora intermedia TaxID=5142 RepID=A0ABR3CZG7_NEUIN
MAPQVGDLQFEPLAVDQEKAQTFERDRKVDTSKVSLRVRFAENPDSQRTPRCPTSRAASLFIGNVLIVISVAVALFLVAAQFDSLSWNYWRSDISNPGTNVSTCATDTQYLLGVGKGDITGPVVEINLMGYADPKQLGSGLRQRLYSRAFIVGSLERPQDRFVYLVLDTQSGDTAVRYGIIKALKELGPEYAFYGHHNIALTGTHSHAGPGGWLNYLLPQITSKGFDRQGYQAIVDGAVLSIRKAHESLQPGYLSAGTTKVFGANINRSLFSYLANPEAERMKYVKSEEEDGSVEKDLTMLKFQRASDGKNIGVLTWFPVHGTSMLGNSTVVTGDNKGVAAWLFEKSVRGDSSAAEDFVAGFSQANMGDVSPNVLGAWCEDESGSQCSFKNSTCSNGKSQACHGRGPAFKVHDDGASSCFEIGRRQFEPAKQLYDHLINNPSPVRGPWVKAFHTFHDMSNFTFIRPDGRSARTCPAALGYSFAAGTTDGPGAFDFTQHNGNENTTMPIWKVARYFIKAPGEEQKACQHPKPILLDVGEILRPYDWSPNIVDVQAFRVGQFAIIVSPGEATTMAGRRWKEAVGQSFKRILDQDMEQTYGYTGGPSSNPIVVLGGPANTYTHYITTEEEYQIQRYEGASTLYGPDTLNAYINVTLSFLPYLSSESTSPPAHDEKSFPPDNTNRSLSFIPAVVRDAPPLFKGFGDVLVDVDSARGYHRGDAIRVVFVGANPRNNLRLEGTYAAVEKLFVDQVNPQKSEWRTVRTDEDWSLIYSWKRKNSVMGTSEVEITWETGEETDEWWDKELGPGVYRLKYYGDSKSLFGGKVQEFEGVSGAFTLV